MLSPSLLCYADVAELPSDEEGGTLIARKVGEAVQNTLGAVVTAMDIPLGELCSLLIDFFFFFLFLCLEAFLFPQNTNSD